MGTPKAFKTIVKFNGEIMDYAEVDQELLDRINDKLIQQEDLENDGEFIEIYTLDKFIEQMHEECSLDEYNNIKWYEDELNDPKLFKERKPINVLDTDWYGIEYQDERYIVRYDYCRANELKILHYNKKMQRNGLNDEKPKAGLNYTKLPKEGFIEFLIDSAFKPIDQKYNDGKITEEEYDIIADAIYNVVDTAQWLVYDANTREIMSVSKLMEGKDE